jgi:hypothetical protein
MTVFIIRVNITVNFRVAISIFYHCLFYDISVIIIRKFTNRLHVRTHSGLAYRQIFTIIGNVVSALFINQIILKTDGHIVEFGEILLGVSIIT